MYKLGWFSTGRGPGSRGLLTSVHEAISRGEIKAEISFVFCNREPGEAEGSDLFIDLVNKYRLPLVTFSSRRFKSKSGQRLSPEWRLEYDCEVMKRLAGYNPDLSILAGYMLVVGPEMCRRYDMLNLHPALPDGPKGTWQEVIWKLIETNAERTGAMMHLATPELDRGPVVTYFSFAIRGGAYDRLWKEVKMRPLAKIRATEGENNALFRLIRSEGAKREIPLIIATIKAFSEGRIRIVDKKLVTAGGAIISSYDLTYDVDGYANRA